MRRMAVMGSGSWGTGFGMVLCDAGGDVVMWAREPEVEESINTTHTNEMFHPGIALPEQMTSVASALRKVGLGSQVDELEVGMNRAAELAAYGFCD